MSKDERVMVFPRLVLENIGIFQGLNFDWEKYVNPIMSKDIIRFKHRNEVEEDPSFKQIIPYVIIESGGNILHYTRGKKSGEKRLVAKGSIGIGGHVSDIDDSIFHNKNNYMWDIYKAAVEREVFEEINIESNYQETIIAVLNDDSDAVGQVHFGIIHLWRLEEPAVTKREQQITQLDFMKPKELLKRTDLLENWSSICVDSLNAILKFTKG
jgi:predicted NUDIX family phosphoesterase